jgi:hypothetical protein
MEIQITNYDKLRKSLAEAPRTSAVPINLAIQKTIIEIQGATIVEAPVYTGALRANVKYQSGNLWGRVYVDKNYALAVHEGQKPHYVPIDPLTRWTMRKFGLTKKQAYGRAKAIQKKIAEKGTKANPFMDRAIKKTDKRIDQYFDKALDEIIKAI